MREFSSFLPSALALGTLLVVALAFTLARPHLRPDARRSLRFAIVIGLTILAQGVHFLEEYRSQFFARFPETFGLQPMSESAFVWFNVVWLAIWIIALFAVRAGLVIAVWPLWFLALATVLNLFAHPILALRAGGYFPGLITAPLVGLPGVLAIRELMTATAHDSTVTKSR